VGWDLIIYLAIWKLVAVTPHKHAVLIDHRSLIILPRVVLPSSTQLQLLVIESLPQR
jgi:hypothetical protein